jgi:hypothetical protein
MYRDDDAARAQRANALIDEIADLERQKVAHATADQRLEAARHELSALQAHAAPAPAPAPPALTMHLLVFGASAAAAFVAYNLVF